MIIMVLRVRAGCGCGCGLWGGGNNLSLRQGVAGISVAKAVEAYCYCGTSKSNICGGSNNSLGLGDKEQSVLAEHHP